MDGTDTPVILIRRGRPEDRIFLRSNPSPVEEYARDELRNHLHKMTGESPCIRRDYWRHFALPEQGNAVYINDTDAAQAAGMDTASLNLSEEAFHLETRQGNLYLVAGGPRGVLYGVYEILERLGCRWFTPEITHIPQSNEVTFGPVCETQTPAFEYRDEEWFVSAGDPTWAARNRLNGHYTPIPGYMGGFVDYGLFTHTIHRLVPPGEFFDTHPEYFCLVNGQRIPSHVCLTNPDVLKIATERTLQYMRAKPNCRIFSVSQNDTRSPCECPSCTARVEKEGSQSGPWIHFCNAIAEETVKEFPDNLINTEAYMYTIDAPRHVRLHPNVRVRLCVIEICQGHGMDVCDHPRTVQAYKALQDWGAITDQLYIWHYCTNFQNYTLPMPNMDELEHNLKLYRNKGVCGVMMQGCGEDGGAAAELGALRAYVLSKLLWNPDRDVWSLVDEFLPAYYGSAASRVRAYMDLYHDRVRNDRSIHPSMLDPTDHPLFQGDINAQAEVLLAQGEQNTSGAERDRVSMLKAGVTCARLFHEPYTFTVKGDTYESSATDADREDLAKLGQVWRECAAGRISEWTWLEMSLRQFQRHLTSYPVEWLRDDIQSLAIVPALGGSIAAWNAFDRQWLADTNPDYNIYNHPSSRFPPPMPQGYGEFGGRVALGGAFEQSRENGNTLVLRGEHQQLHIRRTYSLSNGALRVSSRVTNRRSKRARLVWGVSLHLLLPDLQSITIQSQAGSRTLSAKDMPDGDQNLRYAFVPENAVIVPKEETPLQAWHIQTPEHRIEGTIACGPAHQVAFMKTPEQGGMLGIDLRTINFWLEPEQSITTSLHAGIQKPG